MAHKGKIQLTLVAVAPPELAEEGKRIFRTHAPWMEATHHRDGDKALLGYTVSISPELSDLMDPTSAPTGNTVFVLTEIYETEAGVVDHFEQASSWEDFPAAAEFLGKCQVSGSAMATIVNSLW